VAVVVHNGVLAVASLLLFIGANRDGLRLMRNKMLFVIVIVVNWNCLVVFFELIHRQISVVFYAVRRLRILDTVRFASMSESAERRPIDFVSTSHAHLLLNFYFIGSSLLFEGGIMLIY
jgi:hypothetical protein